MNQNPTTRRDLFRLGGGLGLALAGGVGLLKPGSEVLLPEVEILRPVPTIVPDIRGNSYAIGGGWVLREWTITYNRTMDSNWYDGYSGAPMFAVWRPPELELRAMYVGSGDPIADLYAGLGMEQPGARR